MTNDLGPVVGRIDSLDVELMITQREGAPVVATTRFPLVKTIANFEVSRLSLIVFDYNRSDISEQNKDMMRQSFCGHGHRQHEYCDILHKGVDVFVVGELTDECICTRVAHRVDQRASEFTTSRIAVGADP